MAAAATLSPNPNPSSSTASLPNPALSRLSPSPRTSTPPPPPPPSRAVPTDLRSSLAAWWNNASYKEARYAEERLLRRMAMFSPGAGALPSPPASKGWFAWNTGARETEQAQEERAGEAVSEAVEVGGSGLVATLRNVFVPTPNPDDAPLHPADPIVVPADSAASSTASLSSAGSKPHGKRHHQHGHLGLKHHKKHADYINTLEISAPEDRDSKEAVVVLHGYAAALGFFFRNWESISTSAHSTHRRTFFLDWLGMGLSSRPSPSLLASPSTAPIPARVSRAEHFFLSSLESWRQAAGVDKMVLVGHSLGGYLASAYAVRYPERVSGLILVSPAGIPRGPDYKKYALSGEQEAAEERARDQEVEAAAAELEGGGKTGANEPKGEAKEWREKRENSLLRKNAMKFFVWGWEKGLSPFSILRASGPFGPLWASKYTTRRFSSQSDDDIRDIHAYIYNTSILKGSGEYCISHILAPGAYARVPILDRIHNVKVPVTFLYGDNDWMDVEGGRESVKALKKAGNPNASVHVVPKAGHHLYLDNSEVSNRLIGDAIRALPRSA